MNDRNPNSNANKGFLNKIVKPKIVKICIYLSLCLFLIGLLIGVIVAAVFGPEGYNIIDNYISDLGSFRYTPTPFILDSIAMITAFLLVPIFLYSYKNLISGIKKVVFNSNNSLSRRIFNAFIAFNIFLGLVCLIIAVVGLFGVGLFSEDRSTELSLHYIFSIIVFGGLATGALFNGLAILLRKSIYPRLLGLYMLIVPPTVAILFVFPPPMVTLPFLEWMMLFGAFLWLIPEALIILRKLRKE